MSPELLYLLTPDEHKMKKVTVISFRMENVMYDYTFVMDCKSIIKYDYGKIKLRDQTV